MQTPLVSGVFWQQLLKSGLLSTEQAASATRELRKRGITDDTDAAAFLVRRNLLTQYQADRLMEGRSRGFFFDRYRILDLLGAGGMGWVYRAADTTTNEVVALKVLLDRLKEDRGMLARFQQEARAGLRLDHPHIVRTRATASAGGMHYMVLDFVEGPSLLELLLRQKRLPWDQACDFARQSALALHHAHQSGWIHRDVKPQNLLVDQSGFVKLLDFGLAMKREGEGGDEFSIAMIFGHECIGTPAFMAPEQARDSLNADARSDIYGLGCTLYAALTGDTPFPLRNPMDVVKAHQTQAPKSVREIVPDIPVGVADIVSRMLAKNPDDRFRTAEAAAAALEKWSKPGPVKFDFKEVLAERTQHAMQKVAELHKSRPIASGSASSTTRLSKLSSVATGGHSFGPDKAPPSMRNAHPGEASAHTVLPTFVDRQVSITATDVEAASFPTVHRGKVLTPLGGGASIPLTTERIVIGRSDESDLQIGDASVSGKHCELLYDGSWWWITDFKSRNGTRVNGKPITRRQIGDGDVISIGSHVRLRFESARVSESERKPCAHHRLTTPRLLLIGLGMAIVAGTVIALMLR